MRAVMLVLPAALVLAAVSAPLIQTWLGHPHGESIYDAVRPICHQYPTRTLWLAGRPMALCSRCFAGYAGIVVAAAWWPVAHAWRRRALLGLMLFLICILEPIVQLSTPYVSSNPVRLFTGFLGGFALSLVIIPSIRQERRRASP